MDVVKELDLSTDSDQSDNSEPSDVEVLKVDSGDAADCGELSSSSSEGEESGNAAAGGSDRSTTQKRAKSLLDVLKCPQPSTLARKRVITSNHPPTGKRSCKSTNQSKAAVNIKPQQRVVEFKDEYLCVSGGKLFCNACREEVNLKKSSVKNHIQSVKHKNGKDALRAKNKRDKSISEAILQHNSEVHPRGETLPMEHQVHRVKVVESFLRAAVPLSKIQYFRKLLEETGYRLTDRQC